MVFRKKTSCLLLALLCLSFLIRPAPALALAPEEVLVIANRNAAKSQGLARFYMEQRAIPKENLLLIWVPDQETCSREDYDKKVVPPVRRFLASHPGIRALATVYGLPIRIAPLATDPSTIAAFDSELALVKHGSYALRHWQPNPLFLGYKDPVIPKGQVLMVSRLDGPDAGVVRRMITESLAAEKQGLTGTAYLDARWPPPARGQKLSAYAFYDYSLHKTARYLKENQIMPVVLDDSQTLFQAGSAPETALYCGWYSLGQYIDAFQWQPGSVGFHMASHECATLRGTGKTWCKQILENGASATLGPVSEPYIQAFPVPEIFFGLLPQATLVEAYMASLPFLSWQMMLVGDPLYRVSLSRPKTIGKGDIP